jgi:hypothetical protein
MVKGYGIGVLAADSGWILPESAGDLRCETLLLAIGGPFFGDDSNLVPAIEEDP